MTRHAGQAARATRRANRQTLQQAAIDAAAPEERPVRVPPPRPLFPSPVSHDLPPHLQGLLGIETPPYATPPPAPRTSTPPHHSFRRPALQRRLRHTPAATWCPYTYTRRIPEQHASASGRLRAFSIPASGRPSGCVGTCSTGTRRPRRPRHPAPPPPRTESWPQSYDRPTQDSRGQHW